ncbi:hypothetical protein OPT61_g1137 [Boeremia exigua]|uniref:Uncharacterized protein n=1 Tax=Boeremia exigua TaxID=749465 RepID=A0ACC2IRJ5_9PLEO|nr:hypothetical protein OPT61_g1137 [Boeremia exigua]
MARLATIRTGAALPADRKDRKWGWCSSEAAQLSQTNNTAHETIHTGLPQPWLGAMTNAATAEDPTSPGSDTNTLTS